MPRAARFKIAAIGDLLRQLEFAPPTTRLRQMNAAERLIGDIERQQNYPQEFIIYRITGYRSDLVEEPVTFVGQALLPDLITLVQALSEPLDLKSDHEGRLALPLSELAGQLNVSHKTIQRYRKQGLVCHYVIFSDGSSKLACFQDALERFVSGHRQQLDKAAAFTRLEGPVEVQIVEQARRLRDAEHLSLNEAALRLARQHGRAHETIRMMLRRHDRRASDPIFVEPGPLTPRDILLIHRAWIRGVEPGRLAERFGKTRPTIHRAINRRRAELLGALKLRFIAMPTFDLPEAAEVILSAPAVVSGLDQPALDRDAIGLIEWARRAPEVPLDLEHALLAAHNFLKRRSAAAIEARGEWPRSGELDAIETDLRWAELVKRRLIMLGFPAAVRRIEQNLHRPLNDQTTHQILSVLKLAIEVVGQAVDAIDPGREQRLERIAGFAMERALAQSNWAVSASRAAVRHPPQSIALNESFAFVDTPAPWLELRSDLRAEVTMLAEPARTAIALRYGLAGSPPLTCPALAQRLGKKPVGVARLLQRAIRDLRAAARTR